MVITKLLALIETAQPVAQSQQLRLAATCGLDSPRRRDLIRNGLTLMVSVVLQMASAENPTFDRLRKKFNDLRKACGRLAEMSSEWGPNPICVRSWMNSEGINQEALMKCLSHKVCRTFLDTVNKIFIGAYFVMMQGTLTLKHNVVLQAPCTFLYFEKCPLIHQTHEAQFAKDGDLLILSDNIDACHNHVRLFMKSSSDETEPQQDEYIMMDTETEPQRAKNNSDETEPQQDDIMMDTEETEPQRAKNSSDETETQSGGAMDQEKDDETENRIVMMQQIEDDIGDLLTSDFINEKLIAAIEAHIAVFQERLADFKQRKR